MPGLCLVDPEVRPDALDHVHQVPNAPVNVGFVRVRVRPKHVRQLLLLVVLNEVPNLEMRPQFSDELALVIFDLAELVGVLSLLLFDLLSRSGQFHGLAVPLLLEVFLYARDDRFDLQVATLVREPLDHDGVLAVLQHLVVDSAQGLGTSQPEILLLLIVLVVVLPDPSPLTHTKKEINKDCRLRFVTEKANFFEF